MTFYDAPNQQVVRPDASGPGIMIETPTLATIAPATAVAGSAPLTVTCTGTKFSAGTTVVLDGNVNVATTYVSPTQVTFQLTPKATAGQSTVTVRNGNEVAQPGKTFTYTAAG